MTVLRRNQTFSQIFLNKHGLVNNAYNPETNEKSAKTVLGHKMEKLGVLIKIIPLFLEILINLFLYMDFDKLPAFSSYSFYTGLDGAYSYPTLVFS